MHEIMSWVIAVLFIFAGASLITFTDDVNRSSGFYAATFQMFGCGLAVLWALYLFRDK